MEKYESEIAAKKLDKKIHRIATKINRIEKIPREYGTVFSLHTSEIHTIADIGRNPGINVTELAEKQGKTKGAVSQVITRLEKKQLIVRMKEIDNDKTVFLKLSNDGLKAFAGYKKFHAKIHSPLANLIERASHDQISFLEEFFLVVEGFCDQVLDKKK